jgi:hypothetical protein
MRAVLSQNMKETWNHKTTRNLASHKSEAVKENHWHYEQWEKNKSHFGTFHPCLIDVATVLVRKIRNKEPWLTKGLSYCRPT